MTAGENTTSVGFSASVVVIVERAPHALKGLDIEDQTITAVLGRNRTANQCVSVFDRKTRLAFVGDRATQSASCRIRRFRSGTRREVRDLDLPPLRAGCPLPGSSALPSRFSEHNRDRLCRGFRQGSGLCTRIGPTHQRGRPEGFRMDAVVRHPKLSELIIERLYETRRPAQIEVVITKRRRPLSANRHRCGPCDRSPRRPWLRVPGALNTRVQVAVSGTSLTRPAISSSNARSALLRADWKNQTGRGIRRRFASKTRCFSMASIGVTPTPAAKSTTGRFERSSARTKAPAGALASIRSPTFSVSCRWDETKPSRLTLIRYAPSEGPWTAYTSGRPVCLDQGFRS